jgi:hypothetical protein
MVFDAGRGERLLKYFVKMLASTCQERSGDEFNTQMAKRAQEMQVLTRACNSISHHASFEAIVKRRQQEQEAATRQESHSFPHKPAFSLLYQPNYTSCLFKWHGSNSATQVHPAVRSWLCAHWDADTIGNASNLGSLECYAEYRHQGPGFDRTYRAHPTYQGKGPWYDWALINFGEETNYPARLLLFYRKHDEVVGPDGVVTSSGIHALIHCVQYDRESRSQRFARMEETHLCKRWKLECTAAAGQPASARRTAQCRNVPVFRSVPVESIQDYVLVVEEDPGICEQWVGEKLIWEMHDQRTVWPTKFIVE